MFYVSKRVIQITFTITLLLVSGFLCSSKFSITPLPGTVLPTVIPKGHSVTAYYRIQNNTLSPQKNISIRLPPNVSQILPTNTASPGVFPNTCESNFDLPSNVHYFNVCILHLIITGEVNSDDPDPANHLALCQDDLDCSTVDEKENELNVREGKENILARVFLMNEFTGSPKTTGRYPTAYISNDGGISWSKKEISGAQGRIRALSCGNQGLSCAAVGDVYTSNKITIKVYNSENGGLSWTPHTLGTFDSASSLSSVTCNDNNCVAGGGYSKPGISGSYPIVYISSDNGHNWTPHYPQTFGPYGSAIRAISCDKSGLSCTAIGAAGLGRSTAFLVYTSKDAGISWSFKEIVNHLAGTFESITCNNNGQVCLATGHLAQNQIKQPIIYRSTTGGDDWESYLPYTEFGGEINSISCYGDNGNNCLAVGATKRNDGFTYLSQPIIYRSIDGGLNWIAHNFTDDEFHGGTFSSVTCSNKGKYCTVVGYQTTPTGNKSIIVTSMDGGQNWIYRSLGLYDRNHAVPYITEEGISVSGSNS